METKSKPLNIVFIALVVLFLLFCGGAVWVTLADGGVMGSGWRSGISWMWVPAVLFLTLGILIARVLYVNRKAMKYQ
jgi:hypothetical protein